MTFVPHLLPVNRGSSPPAMRIRAGHDNGGGPGGLRGSLRRGTVHPPAAGRKVADIRNVWYSNYCDVSLHIDARAGLLVAISAIDNMVKGRGGTGDPEYEPRNGDGGDGGPPACSAGILTSGRTIT